MESARKYHASGGPRGARLDPVYFTRFHFARVFFFLFFFSPLLLVELAAEAGRVTSDGKAAMRDATVQTGTCRRASIHGEAAAVNDDDSIMVAKATNTPSAFFILILEFLNADARAQCFLCCSEGKNATRQSSLPGRGRETLAGLETGTNAIRTLGGLCRLRTTDYYNKNT